jgi:GR25 family glycosyltransferase involved in LPS biosynthesis
MNNIPPIYIINLEKSVDRMNNIANIMKKYNLKFNRFNAVYGKTLSNNEIENVIHPICFNMLCSNGMIGCALSHVKLWRQLLNDNTTDNYLILEDDIGDININKLIKLLNFIDKEKIEYNMINLNTITSGGKIIKNKIKIEENLYLGQGLLLLGLSSYIINKKGAQILINNIDKHKVKTHIDLQINIIKYLYDTNFIYYVVEPNIVKLHDIDSNQSTLVNKKTNIMFFILEKLKLGRLKWYLNTPLIIIKRNLEIDFYTILLLILLIINIKKIKNQYITYFIILELILTYFYK